MSAICCCDWNTGVVEVKWVQAISVTLVKASAKSLRKHKIESFSKIAEDRGWLNNCWIGRWILWGFLFTYKWEEDLFLCEKTCLELKMSSIVPFVSPLWITQPMVHNNYMHATIGLAKRFGCAEELNTNHDNGSASRLRRVPSYYWSTVLAKTWKWKLRFWRGLQMIPRCWLGMLL